MQKLLEVVHTETSAMYNIAFKMKGMARSFYETGNDSVAARLVMVAEHLEASANNINKALGETINQQVIDGQRRCTDLLKAVLAGVGVDDNDRKED